MRNTNDFSGVSSLQLTPFQKDKSIDLDTYYPFFSGQLEMEPDELRRTADTGLPVAG